MQQECQISNVLKLQVKFVLVICSYSIRQIIIFQSISFSHHSLASSISSQLGCCQLPVSQYSLQHPFAFRYSALLKSFILLLPIYKYFNLSNLRIFISTIQFSSKSNLSSPTSLSTPFAVFRAELQCKNERRFAGTLSACAFQQLYNYRCVTPNSETKCRSCNSWSCEITFFWRGRPSDLKCSTF
ncbi:Hypothetical_protein [Hexamita inflata]|uniref:Hypothetical_protein n=1 Tax=Hexamita inflata TaxID=28002 RepID=A0AA86QIP3_9EUKA|nr:Hypothetical protein HINF_LOCUS47854 [Hexamita inflata]